MTTPDKNIPQRWNPNPKTPPAYLVTTRNIGHARRAAMKRLMQAHPEEFQKLYEEEATARGITVRRGKTPKKYLKAPAA